MMKIRNSKIVNARVPARLIDALDLMKSLYDYTINSRRHISMD